MAIPEFTTLDEPCPSCGGTDGEITLRNDKHYADLTCLDCGRHIKFVGNPDKNRRPESHKKIARKYSQGYCQLCLRKENELPPRESLEGHHVIEFQDGGGDTKDNTWVVCTSCHVLIHHQRTYLGHYKSLVEKLGDKWKLQLRKSQNV
jgi:ribosomal protein L34E